MKEFSIKGTTGSGLKSLGTILVIGLITLSLPSISYSQQLRQLSTSIAADTMWIGDQTVFSIELQKDISTEISLPQFKDNQLTDKIEIVEGPWVDTVSRDSRDVRLTINYRITSFDAGEYIIQGFPLVVGEGDKPDTVHTPTVNHLFVKTFEIDTTKQEIFDIKDNIDTPVTWAEIKEFIISWKGLIVLAAFILIAGIVWLIIWNNRRRNSLDGKPKEPAHIIALRAMNALEHKKLWESGKIKEYYSILTDIIRIYIENRYGVSTMELTTPEILQAITEINTDKQYGMLEELLSEADLVKFAKMVPTPEDNTHCMDIARDYVDQTKLIVIDETAVQEK